jgi:hypothetical protein
VNTTFGSSRATGSQHAIAAIVAIDAIHRSLSSRSPSADVNVRDDMAGSPAGRESNRPMSSQRDEVIDLHHAFLKVLVTDVGANAQASVAGPGVILGAAWLICLRRVGAPTWRTRWQTFS